MQRIEILERADAPEKTAALLEAVETQMGRVPNILATMAQSPSALEGYLGFAGALEDGVLGPALREQIALAVAGANRCDYCASVHTALGKKRGLQPGELSRNLAGTSSNETTDGILRFVTRIVKERGHVSTSDLADVRALGVSEEEIVEIIAHTALNIFTNYFNHIADTDIDFPTVATADEAAA